MARVLFSDEEITPEGLVRVKPDMKFLGINDMPNKAIKRHTHQSEKLPIDLASGDIIILSPTGKLRARPAETRTQRIWNAIDIWMRKRLF